MSEPFRGKSYNCFCENLTESQVYWELKLVLLLYIGLVDNSLPLHHSDNVFKLLWHYHCHVWFSVPLQELFELFLCVGLVDKLLHFPLHHSYITNEVLHDIITPNLSHTGIIPSCLVKLGGHFHSILSRDCQTLKEKEWAMETTLHNQGQPRGNPGVC